MASSPHLHQIARDGLSVVEGVIPPGAVGEVRDSVLATAASHKVADPRSRLDKVSGLINFDQSFAPFLAEPRLLGLCKALLGEHLRVSYTTCMVTHPGNERGAWHSDWPFNQKNAGRVPAPYPDAVLHLTTIWMLTPFTADTGTLVLPGSHRRRAQPRGRTRRGEQSFSGGSIGSMPAGCLRRRVPFRAHRVAGQGRTAKKKAPEPRSAPGNCFRW